MLETDLKIKDSDILTDDRAFLPGYGQMSDAVRKAIHQAATLEGLLVDPIYTGKSLSCLLQGLEAGVFEQAENIIFGTQVVRQQFLPTSPSLQDRFPLCLKQHNHCQLIGTG